MLSSVIIIIHSMSIKLETWYYGLWNYRFNKRWTNICMRSKIIFICRISYKFRLSNLWVNFFKYFVVLIMANEISIVCGFCSHRRPFIFRCPKIHCNTRKIIHFLSTIKILCINRLIGIFSIFSHHILKINGIIFH